MADIPQLALVYFGLVFMLLIPKATQCDKLVFGLAALLVFGQILGRWRDLLSVQGWTVLGALLGAAGLLLTWVKFDKGGLR
jgi:hypothetical protein